MPPKKRSRASDNPNHEGVVFSNTAQMQKFDEFFDRKYATQKFVNLEALDKLSIKDGVQTLFEIIGWPGFLTGVRFCSKKYTVELLSSVSFDKDKDTLSFRLANTDCNLTTNQLCTIVKGVTDNTFGPSAVSIDFDADAFWKEITNENVHEAKSAKASRIIHPTLRVAHRLIASILFPREDLGSVNTAELNLLFCMTKPHAFKPNFGAFLADRIMWTLSPKCTNRIHCTGFPSMLAECANITLDNSLALVRQDITVKTLSSMHMLEVVSNGFKWTIDLKKGIYLTIDQSNSHILGLANPVRSTDWKLSAHIQFPSSALALSSAPITEPEPLSTDAGDAQPSGTTHPETAAGPSQTPSLQQVYDRLDDIQTSITTLTDSVAQDRQLRQTQYEELRRLLLGLQSQQSGEHPPL